LTVSIKGLGNGSQDGAGERGVMGLSARSLLRQLAHEEMDSKQQCVMLLSIAHSSFKVALAFLGVNVKSSDENGCWEGR